MKSFVSQSLALLALLPMPSFAREVALDVCGGRDLVYLQRTVDRTNINLLWSVQPVGEYVMLVSRVDQMALDASAGTGIPYPRIADANNINHLWLLAKVGDHYMIWSAVRNVVLDANAGTGNPYLSECPDPRNANQLWELRSVGEEVMLIPKVEAPEIVVDSVETVDEAHTVLRIEE